MSRVPRALLDLIVVFSLSGILLSRIWLKLSSPWGWADWTCRADHVIVIGIMGLMIGGMLSLSAVARRSRLRICTEGAKLGFLLVTWVGLWILCSVIWPDLFAKEVTDPSSGRTAMAISLVVLGTALLLFVIRRDVVVRSSRFLLIMLLPVSISAFLQSGSRIAFLSPSLQSRVCSTASRGHAHKVVVLLLDEMDQALAFDHRQADLKMPEFDRFCSQAFIGTNAYPPGYMTTLSVPSFLTGRLMAGAQMLQSGNLLVTEFGTGRKGKFDTWPNLFSEVRSLGMHSALISDVLPYPHMMKQWPDFMYRGVQPPSVEVSIMRQLQNLPCVDRAGLLPKLQRVKEKGTFVERFRLTLEKSKLVAADPRYDFTFIHLCMPHEPFIYDRSKGGYSDDPSRTYSDNLALSDRVLGEIRRAMESSGQWDSSSVIILSDHWWRLRPGKKDHRAVFLVKLPNQKSGLIEDRPFNSIIFHDLVLELLQGRLSNPTDLKCWIDSHTSFSESPITKSRL